MGAKGTVVMKKTLSITRNTLFRRLYAKGKTAVCHDLALYVQKSNAPVNRLGITVSKKLGKAVIRNRTRRRIKEAYRSIEERLPSGYNIVIVARICAVNKKMPELRSSLLKLLKKTDIKVSEE